MRIAWKQYGADMWIGRIGACMISLRQMSWHDPRAREFREMIDRAWVASIREYDNDMNATTIAEAAFETAHQFYDGGLQEAQKRAVEIARETGRCKRAKREREALSPEAVDWLENRLLETLRTSYARWRDQTARFGKGVYPEPAWSTARLADEAAQYHRPDELEVSDKRFYSLVRTTLERLRRRGLVASSGGVVEGRETTLWEPV